MASDLIERLRELVQQEDECCQFGGDGFGGGNIFRLAADRIASLEAEVAALREGLFDLLPTPLCGEAWGLPDDEGVSITVNFGEIRRARALLNRGDGNG